ncbi:unnamed protein product [Gadus morhua 'NCC']
MCSAVPLPDYTCLFQTLFTSARQKGELVPPACCLERRQAYGWLSSCAISSREGEVRVAPQRRHLDRWRCEPSDRGCHRWDACILEMFKDTLNNTSQRTLCPFRHLGFVST